MMTRSLFILLAFLLGSVSPATANIAAGRPLRVTIQGVPTEESQRVTGVYPVSSDGTINMPYIGHIRAAGLTTSAVARSIENAYKQAQIYTTPTIQVVAEDLDSELRENLVTVGGQVRSPGPVKYVPGITLYQAIANRGGATEFGAMNRVLVHSGGEVREYDCTKARDKAIVLKADDTIEVPQKNWIGR